MTKIKSEFDKIEPSRELIEETARKCRNLEQKKNNGSILKKLSYVMAAVILLAVTATSSVLFMRVDYPASFSSDYAICQTPRLTQVATTYTLVDYEEMRNNVGAYGAAFGADYTCLEITGKVEKLTAYEGAANEKGYSSFFVVKVKIDEILSYRNMPKRYRTGDTISVIVLVEPTHAYAVPTLGNSYKMLLLSGGDLSLSGDARFSGFGIKNAYSLYSFSL